ncbi:uncharacterized protein LOC141642521 [Silene latifolia]|uniref:uncharacterized protein LOC141642521 n=1 Tax=Silene latifolia TaxID=37657 RepID=UPI003D77566B
MKTTLQCVVKNITLRRRSPTLRFLPCVNYHTKTTPFTFSPISSTHLSNRSSPFNFSSFYPSLITFHDYSTSIISHSSNHIIQHDSDDRDLVVSEWEDDDDDDDDPDYGDGGAGGGIALQNVSWGETVLSIAQEVLLQFGDDIKLFAFKTTPRGYIYVRLDKLTDEYGCPDIAEIERFNREYQERLEEEGSKGKIPDNLALEVSSPGANRLLVVPDDLLPFKDFPMQVSYVEEGKTQVKVKVFSLESIDTETEHCVWKLADVQENWDTESKGKPLNRKQRDWRLKLPYTMTKKVALCCMKPDS